MSRVDTHWLQEFANPETTRRGACLDHILKKFRITGIPVETVSAKSVSVTVVVLGTGIIEMATIMLVRVARMRNQ